MSPSPPLLLLTLSLLSACAAKQHTNSYNTLCAIFETAYVSNLNRAEMGELINTTVAQKLEGTDAQATYQAMLMLNQQDRYSTVKSAASAQQNSDWSCDAMQTLLSP